MKHRKVWPAALVTAVVAAAPTGAHHSLAMFDRTKTLTLTGTVKEFQWTNPHVWVQVMIPDESGELKEWGFESGSPAALVRSGWNRRIIAAGDKVTVVTNPMRDGSKGGSLNSITLPDGKVLRSGGPGGPPPPGSGPVPPVAGGPVPPAAN